MPAPDFVAFAADRGGDCFLDLLLCFPAGLVGGKTEISTGNENDGL
jgi:hypothetical protein